MTQSDDALFWGSRDDIDAYVEQLHSEFQFYAAAAALAAWEHRRADQLTGYFAWRKQRRARAGRNAALRFAAGAMAAYFVFRLAVWAGLLIYGVPQ